MVWDDLILLLLCCCGLHKITLRHFFRRGLLICVKTAYNQAICTTAMPYFALFDDAVSGRAKLYQNHVESRLFHHNELDSLDDTLQKGWQKGLHAVLFADYEFGLPLMGMASERGGNLEIGRAHV